VSLDLIAGATSNTGADSEVGARTSGYDKLRNGTVRRHPSGLAVLCLTETWERFSYYGMRSILVLYMVKHALLPNVAGTILLFPQLQALLSKLFGPLSIQATASQVYGIYTALMYLTPIAGGILADRVLGARRSVIVGAILMSLGHFMMAFESLFLIALVVLILGIGAFKPNTTTQVGRLYEPGDPRRDRAYSIFYVGINLGSFISPFVIGSLGERQGWHWGFSAAGIGMLIATFIYVGARRHLPPDPPLPHRTSAKQSLSVQERRVTIALIVLFLFVSLFWATFQQQGNTLAIYADTEINRNISLFAAHFEFPTSWIQAINPLFIMLLTPVITWRWTRQMAGGREPGSVAKMAIGCAFACSSFIVLSVAAIVTPAGSKASCWWLIGHLLLLTTGELYLSPVSLSLISKVAPMRFASMFMGLAFLANFIGSYLAGWLGSYWGLISHGTFFLSMAAIAGFGAISIALVSRSFTKLTTSNIKGIYQC
jgi:POT family proton-dependent oligopeptide transporter